jgi:hypothetical protein
MTEPTPQRMRMTFTVKRADNGRFVMACDPLESESAPVIPGSAPPRVKPPSRRVTPPRLRPSSEGVSATPPSFPGYLRSNSRMASPKSKRYT